MQNIQVCILLGLLADFILWERIQITSVGRA